MSNVGLCKVCRVNSNEMKLNEIKVSSTSQDIIVYLHTIIRSDKFESTNKNILLDKTKTAMHG